MIVVDENIAEDQCRRLRRWRIRFRQIGQDIGRQGMQDDQDIIPLLHQLDRPTFFTRDLGFFRLRLCRADYSLVCLAIRQNEAARFIRRFLRHPAFNTKAKRAGTVVRVSAVGLRVWRSTSRLRRDARHYAATFAIY
jgi:hypothetical protein